MTDRIALIRSVDVLVLGGTTGAVACALAAQAAGCSVLLAAPRHGLADDIADTWRLDPEAACNDPLAESIFSDGRCPTPLHARRACEDAVLATDIQLLLGALPCGCVRDAEGTVCGAILAHRGGRSAISAGHIVDASLTAAFARDAGIPMQRRTDADLAVHSRLLFSPEAPLSPDHVDKGIVAIPGQDGTTDARLVERIDHLPLKNITTATLNQLESTRQLAAFDATAIALSAWAWYTPTFGLTGEHPDTWSGSAQHDLGTLATPAPRVWLLSGCAAVSQDVAEALLAPAALSHVGQRLGAHLADHALAKPDPVSAVLPGEPLTAAVCGPHAGLRPIDTTTTTLAYDTTQAPLLGLIDVAVIGGGTGGAPAGIAAAREGASTMVLERLQRMGGVGTLGRIGRYWFGNRTGFTAEIDQRLLTAYGEPRYAKQKGAWWVLEHRQDAWLRMLTEAGGQAWFGASTVAALVTDDCCHGALIATEHGAGVVTASAMVDATGSADLAAAAGAPCRVTDASNVAVQGTGLPAVDPTVDYQNSDHDFCDDGDSLDVTRIHLRTRHKFPNAWDTGPLIDSRERRQIRGVYELTPLDICCDRGFPDAIARAKSNFDSHGFTVHPVFTAFPMDKKPMSAWVSYRCLLPQGIDGILVTGLGMSAHRDALPVVRMQADVQNTGFSAGVAAAMSVDQAYSTQQLPVADLQKRLIALGHLEPAALTLDTAFPPSPAVVREHIATNLDTLMTIAAAFATGEAAWPLLREALEDPERQATAAVILGLQGDRTAAPVLRHMLADSQWDDGWRFTGMGQFGRTLSPIDTYLVALGHCGSSADAAIIISLARTLPADPALSHCRAISLAATKLRERAADSAAALAEVIGDLLQRADLHGCATTDLATAMHGADADPINTREREEALRELHLAVAGYRCGDQDIAKAALQEYAQDLHGHYARHARAVLAESVPQITHEAAMT